MDSVKAGYLVAGILGVYGLGPSNFVESLQWRSEGNGVSRNHCMQDETSLCLREVLLAEPLRTFGSGECRKGSQINRILGVLLLSSRLRTQR